jgi:hypothetical protein
MIYTQISTHDHIPTFKWNYLSREEAVREFGRLSVIVVK